MRLEDCINRIRMASINFIFFLVFLCSEINFNLIHFYVSSMLPSCYKKGDMAIYKIRIERKIYVKTQYRENSQTENEKIHYIKR